MTATESTVPNRSTAHRKLAIIAGGFVVLAIIVVVGVQAKQRADARERAFKNVLTDYREAGQDRLHEIREALDRSR